MAMAVMVTTGNVTLLYMLIGEKQSHDRLVLVETVKKFEYELEKIKTINIKIPFW